MNSASDESYMSVDYVLAYVENDFVYSLLQFEVDLCSCDLKNNC